MSVIRDVGGASEYLLPSLDNQAAVEIDLASLGSIPREERKSEARGG